MFPSRSVVAIWRSLSAEDVAIQDPPDAVSVDRIIEKIDHCSPPRNIHVPSASPRDPLLGGTSHRKHAVPNCNGPSAQWILSAIVQLAYSVGVESFLVHFEEGSQEQLGREHLNCVADCFGRCGKSHVRYRSHHPRPFSAGEQLSGGSIVEIGHFTLQLTCRLDAICRHEREGARTSGVTSSISWWVPMTEPCGIDILVGVYMGMRADFHNERE